MVPTWVTYTVQEGEDLAEIAREQRSTVQDIWESPRNAEVARLRRRPELVRAGDVVEVPQLFLQREVPDPELETEDPPATSGGSEVDEDWPYKQSFELSNRPPSWSFETAQSECEIHSGDLEDTTYVVFLHDHESKRMGGARCRVFHNGRHVEAPRYADGEGAVQFDLQSMARNVVIEWAPSDMPLRPHLPYRKRYLLRCSDGLEAGVRERLLHIGVTAGGSLRDQIGSFQAAYGLPADGRAGSVAAVLASYHDSGSLPPLGSSQPLAPDMRGIHQGAISAVAEVNAPCHFSFRLLRGPDQPWRNAPFTLHVGRGKLARGRLSEEGTLEFGPVLPGDYALWIEGRKTFVPAIPREERYRPILVLPHA